MGNLSQYAEQIQGVQSKLNEAESIKDNMDEIISKRFDEVSKRMMKSLEDLVNTNNKDSVMSSSVTQAVLSIAQNNQLLMRDLEKELRQTNKDMTSNNNAMKSEVAKVGNDVSKTLAGITRQVEAIPTQFPEQIKTDLSGVEKGIRNLMSAISSIPMPEYPKQADMSPQFKRIEKQLIALKKKPNHEFIVHRNSDDLVTKVTAKAI